MNTLNSKNHFTSTFKTRWIGLSTIAILVSVFFIYSCKKTNEECASCNSQFKTNGSTSFNNKQYLSYTENSSNNPGTTLIPKSGNTNVSDLITSTLNGLNLPGLNSTEPVALCLFYTGDINTSSDSTVNGVLFYHKSGDKYLANVWVKDQNTNFIKVNSLSGISNIVSKGDMFKLNVIKNLNAQNILILLDQSKLAEIQHPSVFQVLIDREYSNAAPNGGGGNCSHCNDVPDCSQTDEGHCTFKEEQNGMTQTYCNPICACNSAVSVLADNGYNFSEQEINNLYLIRNEFLLDSEKGRKYIDDYYYASHYLTKNSISLSLALKLYDLHSENVFSELSQFDNSNYNNHIIITPTIKSIINSIINWSRNISTDVRFNSILDAVQNDVELYENKTMLEIKTDFQ